MVDTEFMQKLEKIKSRLSRKYPKGVNFEKLFTIVMDEYLDRNSPEKRIQRREKREANMQKKEDSFSDKQTRSVSSRNNMQHNKLQHSVKKADDINKKQNNSSEKQMQKTDFRDKQTQGKKTNDSRNKQASAEKGVSSKEENGRENKRGINKETKNANKKIPRTNKERTRNIPAYVRDEVFARDGGRCTFVGKNGKRCNSAWNLEIDHIVPYAKGGDNSPENLRLLCAKHNLMEAERSYGKDFMKKYIKKE